MLPTPTDNGARLAAILPTGLASLALGLGRSPEIVLGERQPPAQLPGVRSLIVLVVDGLGHANLRSRAGHARALGSLPTKRIETVIPSTTSAALTTITTGCLPGEHGLIGYKIRHPQLGLISPLRDWQGIERVRDWQLAEPLFVAAAELGVRAAAIGRPSHAQGGLTEAILGGADYHGGQTIADRFAIASRLVRSGEPGLIYLYVDELDRAAHREGWQSPAWLRRLEQLDDALDDLLRTLPGDTGLVMTADHGMVDVAPGHQIMLDGCGIDLEGVLEIGGEPRFRSLFLGSGEDAETVADRVGRGLGKRAWVGTRDAAISAGWFGPMAEGVAERIGEVLVIARGQHAFTLTLDDAQALAMVGQHGGLSDEERGVPLALGGCLAGTGFASAVAAVAAPAAG